MAAATDASFDPKVVLQQVDRIVSSDIFADSPRVKRFLEYIVDRYLNNDQAGLKGSITAREVFEKDSKFDARFDSAVRTGATRLRAKLKAYYDSAGQDDPIIVDLPVGCYVPRITARFPGRVDGSPSQILQTQDRIPPSANAPPGPLGPGSSFADESSVTMGQKIAAPPTSGTPLVWIGAIFISVIGVIVAILATAYGLAILALWLGAVVVVLGYVHSGDTPIARAIVGAYMVTAMSYTSSTSTLPAMLATVINLTQLSPSPAYSFVIGLKFIPLFILVLGFWVILGYCGDDCFFSRPRLRKAYTFTGILFLLTTFICFGWVSGDIRIWQAGLPGGWILFLAYGIILAVNLAVWLVGRSCFGGEFIPSYRQLLSFCALAYLPIALAAYSMDSEYNRVNQYYLDIRRPEAYIAANPDGIKDLEVLLRGPIRDKIGLDLISLLGDAGFRHALRSGTFYKQPFDEPFQLGSRAIIFGYRPDPSLAHARRPFVTIRFPKELADALRFESIDEEK